MRFSLPRALLGSITGLAVATGTVATAPTAAAVSCASPTTTSVTETSAGVTRTYTRSIVTATTSCDWTVPAGVTSLDLLVVGGGGGGGGGVMWDGAGGGGGGGRVIETTVSVTPGDPLALTVGLGGTAGRGGMAQNNDDRGMAPAGNGGSSTVTATGISLTAAGGQAGGNGTRNSGALTYSGAGGNSGSGSIGGAPDWDGAGGGAGQGGTGGAGIDIGGRGANGGAGGLGVVSSISGTPLWFGAGGGGGGSYNTTDTSQGTGGAGGSGVGGNGVKNNGSFVVGLLPTSGAANTGSGGGGGGGVPITAPWGGAAGWPVEPGDDRERLNGAAGAAGVVIIRFASGATLTGATTSGTPQVGSSVTASASGVTGTPTPTSTFQWQSSATGTGGWSNISGADSGTYAVRSADLGQYLRAEVTVTNTDGNAVTYTSASGPVTAATPSSSSPAAGSGPTSTSSPTPSPSPSLGTTAPTSTLLTAPTPVPPAQLPAGQSSVLIGGQPAPVTVAPLPNGGTSLSVAGVAIMAAPQRPDGPAPAGGGQSPQSGQGGTGFQPGSNVAINISGLAPQSQVSAFLFSEPTLLGRLEVGPNGNVIGELRIPPSLATGNHTLQFTGWLPSGEPLVVSTPITVSAVPRTTSQSRTILFDYLSTSLTPAARKAIAGLVAQAKSWTTPRTVVVGYVRNSGATIADRRLAKARALMVARQLRASGMTGPVRIGALKGTSDTTAKARKVVITTR